MIRGSAKLCDGRLRFHDGVAPTGWTWRPQDGRCVAEMDVASPGWTWRSRDPLRRVVVSSREPWRRRQGRGVVAIKGARCEQATLSIAVGVGASSRASERCRGRQNVVEGVRTLSRASERCRGRRGVIMDAQMSTESEQLR